MRALRYSSHCGMLVGLSLIVLGRTLWTQQHDLLNESGALVVMVSNSPLLFVMRPLIRYHSFTLRRIKRLCEVSGISFGVRNTIYPWLYPLGAGTLCLAIVCLIASLALRSLHVFFYSASAILSLLFVISLFLLAPSERRITRVLTEIELSIGLGSTASPPKTARFLLLLIPRRHRENLVGDLEEEFATILVPSYGFTKARFWYWWQVAMSICPLVWAHVQRTVFMAWFWVRTR